MQLLGALRVFADHYQFHLSDQDADVLSDDLRWTSEASARGYCFNERVISVGTCADLNVHWVEVFVSDSEPDIGAAERVFVLPLRLASGMLLLSAIDDLASFRVTPGAYAVYVMGFSLDVDALTLNLERDPSDEELAMREDLERYRIVLVPGAPTRSGVIHGSSTRYGARMPKAP